MWSVVQYDHGAPLNRAQWEKQVLYTNAKRENEKRPDGDSELLEKVLKNPEKH